jgi:tricorn protease
MTFVRSFAFCCGLAAASLVPSLASGAPLILQNPTVSRTQIAFVYGGDIWVVGRSGGQAHRLITGYGLASAPYFSPDGSTIAFSANYDANTNVYLVAAGGGEPRRLTFHPSADVVTGWTRDGSRIVFRSLRNSPTDAAQLYTIPRNGGVATMLPLPDAQGGSFSLDGTHFAYVPNGQWEPYWQGYRGGQVTPIWIANLADSSVERILTGNLNYRSPMWIGDRIYYLSDRNGPFTLYAYDIHTGKSTQLVENRRGFALTSASANDGTIVYSQLDAIHLFDPATGTDRRVPISIAADMAQVRPHWLPIDKEIQNAAISPSGVRAVFEAHGDILTLPAQHGDARNLTATPGIAERDPSWSPNGRWVAYFSDASGEYALRLKDQKGLDPARSISLSPYPSFYYTPTWSPDSKKIAYADKHLGLYYIDVAQDHPRAVKFAAQRYEDFAPSLLDASWSPDSRYIAYSVKVPSFQNAIFVYDTRDGRSHQVTDGMSDSTHPKFDKSGKYLYFLASTNSGFNDYGLDMESDERPVSSSVYAAVLQNAVASPVAPQSDEEPVSSDEPESAPKPAARASAKPAAAAAAASPAIDFDGIGQRIVALPIHEGNYVQLDAGEKGSLLLGLAPLATVSPVQPTLSVLAFNMVSRRAQPLVSGVESYAVSFDGKKMLLQQPAPEDEHRWSIVSTESPVKPGEGDLDTGALEVYVDPHQEWDQMYRETWRIERDYFYDPHYHGLDIAAAERRFAQFLPALASRSDFTYLTQEMIGYLSVGHLWVAGPPPEVKHVSIGLLGADYTVSDGRFRFARIYNGENWNPQLQAPLTQPGVNVHVGDYLLAVNGKPVRPDREVYAGFEETAGKQTAITVGPSANGANSRTVTVVPLPSERGLRYLAWIEENRRLVDRLSGGRLGYAHLPDTQYGGFTSFNRYFFAQVGKQGIILDERYNHGGQIADYVIDVLSRKVTGVIKGRDGETYTDPPLAIYGPKVMVINQYAGSGGDALPWLFRKAALGPIVGVRTWGGLVGIGGYPPLMDGGAVMAPRVAIGGLHGQWEVEGHGIAPDIEVQQDPKLVREGHDPQLETAVNTALRMLQQHPVPHYQAPPYPNHHPQIPPRR